MLTKEPFFRHPLAKYEKNFKELDEQLDVLLGTKVSKAFKM